MNMEDRQYKLLKWVGKGAILFVAFVMLGTTLQGLMPAKEQPQQACVKEIKREKQKINGKVMIKVDYIKRCEIGIKVDDTIYRFEVDRKTFDKAVIGSYMELEY